jgi:hypothetical protein
MQKKSSTWLFPGQHNMDDVELTDDQLEHVAGGNGSLPLFPPPPPGILDI